VLMMLHLVYANCGKNSYLLISSLLRRHC